MAHACCVENEIVTAPRHTQHPHSTVAEALDQQRHAEEAEL
jgi:hypothetical protein